MKNRWVRILLMLWCATVTAQTLSDRQIHYRPGDWISYPVLRYVNAVTLDQQTIYFGTTGGILQYKFYENLWDAPITVSDGLASGPVTALIFDDNTSRLWAVAGNRLCYREPSSENWYVFTNLGSMPITDLGAGGKFMWIIKSGEYWKMDRFALTLQQSAREESLLDQVQWGDKRYTYDEENPEFYFIDPPYQWFPEGYVQDVQFRQYEITNTVPDDFSNLWVGSRGLGGGVVELFTRSLKFMPFGIWSPDVRTMAWDEKGLWIGGASDPGGTGGISYWNLDTDEWEYFEAPFIPHLYSHEINAIETTKDLVWFGTRQGLTRLGRNTKNWRTWTVHDGLWSDVINTLAITDGLLWIGTPLGINRFYMEGEFIEQVREKPLIHRTIFHLEADGQDLWAATDQGLFHYSAEQREWRIESGYGGLLYQDVWSVSATDKDVWVATDDGVMMLDKTTGKWEGFPMSQHFDYDVFHHILADRKAVWVATENGALKYNKEETRWRRFTTEDGLLDNHVQWLMLEGSYIWFATPKGMTRFFWNAPYRID